MSNVYQTIEGVTKIESPIGQREIPLVVHPSKQQGIIVINYPGWNGDINGFNNKYQTLANYVAGQCNIGTVVRMGNHWNPALNYSDSVIDDLAAVMETCRQNASQWCRDANPTFYLMGFSAGAGAIAALAGIESDIDKILLIAPSGDADKTRVRDSLARYTGELYAVVGDRDEVVGPESAQFFSSLAPNASINQIHVVSDCDHQFRGETNGYIVSSLPLMAFSDRLSSPDANSGIKLY